MKEWALPRMSYSLTRQKPQRSWRASRVNLTVSSVPGTRIIDIHYRSPDKELAARVVNTLMSTYVEQNFKTKFESTQRFPIGFPSSWWTCR